MEPRLQRLLIASILVIGALLGWVFLKPSRDSSKHSFVPRLQNTSSGTTSLPDAHLERERFLKSIDALKHAAAADDRRRILGELRADLARMPAPLASATIREILDSHRDAPSQLDFGVAPDGFLKTPSSLRVLLLDELAKVDRTAAAAYAERILASYTSADEWAVSLRNYALGFTNANARSYLQEKWREMVHYEPWQKTPSVAFLEAFDVAVHAGGTELLPDLTELLRLKENPAVAHAAYLALDRLVIQEPALALAKLQTEPELMTGREVTRANYFARANVGDWEQRAILEAYLLDPQHASAELQTFAGLFPNANFMVSYNLLTRATTPDGETRGRHDREALRVVDEWLKDARFEKVNGYLQQIHSRLVQFVKQ